MELLLINGPNLNLLGKREPEVYGHQTLEEIVTQTSQFAESHGLHLQAFQSNDEAQIVQRVHQAGEDKTDFIILNPGGLTHTSIVLRDALLGINTPFIEVHLSNVFARESFRQTSYLSDIAVGLISGLGAKGYELAVTAALDYQEKH